MINQDIEGASGESVYVWLMVKNDLELKIIRGEYAAGERIPPVRKIAEIYEIGTSTATKTLAQLCKDGIIYQRRGVGYFVKPYVKEKLAAEHKKNLEKIIRNALEYADMIDTDPMIIINRINESRKTK
jgi:DNA-binding GntR family transcriptional regulator